jgi:hypothetical protein
LGREEKIVLKVKATSGREEKIIPTLKSISERGCKIISRQKTPPERERKIVSGTKINVGKGGENCSFIVVKVRQHFNKFVRQIVQNSRLEMFRNTIKRFCNATGYCSNGVTISADRNSQKKPPYPPLGVGYFKHQYRNDCSKDIPFNKASATATVQTVLPSVIIFYVNCSLVNLVF